MEPEPPHAVMVPLPLPGHTNPMLKLAKLLHAKSFRITFVVTEYTHRCLLRSDEPPDPLFQFHFVAVPDGLSTNSNREWMKQLEELGISLRTEFPKHFRDLLRKLHSANPVTCVIAGFMSSALHVAEELGILKVLFWTSSACGFMTTLQIGQLVSRGYVPLKDEKCLTNGYLNTELEWIPGMKGIRLKDLTRFIRTTDPDDLILRLEKEEAEIGYGSWGILLNTFDELESEVVAALRNIFPRLYTLGSLSALAESESESESVSVNLNLWKEDRDCLKWLDGRENSTVVYVNFGSITVLTAEQLMEFAWGLAGSNHPFLWIIRPDLVSGDPSPSEEFLESVKERGFVTSWCCQEEVLSHPSIGGFLTHAGWNSVVESIWNGVPMLCWPFFAEQPTNCRYVCNEWGVGMEIEGEVRRELVEGLVKEMMGEKGREMRKRAAEWKEKARVAVERDDGTSFRNMEELVKELKLESLRKKKKKKDDVGIFDV